VRLRPSRTGRRNQRIHRFEVLVEVVQWQVGFVGDVQLVDRQLAGDHHGDLGRFDGERIDVQAIELASIDVDEAGLDVGEFGSEAFADAGFQAFHFAVGEVEEVAGAAGRIEDAQGGEALQEFEQAPGGARRVDGVGPGIDDRRLDDLHDVGWEGEVSAEGVALFLAQRMLEERAENLGGDFRPVGVAGFADLGQLVFDRELDGGGHGEQAAVEVADAFEAAAGIAGGIVHRLEERMEEVVSLGGGLTVFDDVGDGVLGQQPDVLGKKGNEQLEDETLAGLEGDVTGLELGVEQGQAIGGLAGDGFAVIGEDRGLVGGEEKGQRAPAVGEFPDRELVLG